jgi:hypothetical protein
MRDTAMMFRACYKHVYIIHATMLASTTVYLKAAHRYHTVLYVQSESDY